MQPLFNETKNKILSNIIVTLGAFLGFQALSFVIGIYQLKSSLLVAFYIYFFHIFWLTFLFDLHLKKRGVIANAKLNYSGIRMFLFALQERVEHLNNWEYLRHYQNYLVLPGIIYWGTTILMFLNPFNTELKQMILVCSTVALGVAYWFMKEHISRRLEHDQYWIKVLSIVKLYAAYIAFSATVGVTFYYGFEIDFLASTVFTLSFLLVYQALFQHKLLTFYIILAVVGIGLIMAGVSWWIYLNWNTEYLTAGLVMLAVYNTLWGMMHHYFDKTLNKKVALEYIVMMIFIISFIFASHNFGQQIV